MPRRNSNGEGTIYRRKDGRWEASLWTVTASGIRKRVRDYGATRSEAHAKLIELKAAQQKGIPAPDKVWRVGEYLDYWLDNAVRTKRRPLTYQRAESVVRLHLKPRIGKHKLNTLSVHTVQLFIDQLQAADTSRASIFQIRKVLSAALTWAVRKEIIFRNVARLVELPTYRPDEAAYWSADEVRLFLTATREDPLHTLFTVLALYGLRSGEVRGIRWCDVDFDANQLHIRQQVQRVAGQLQEVPLKTATSLRDEPLLKTVKQLLLTHQAKQAAVRYAAADSWQGRNDDRELVFTTSSGRPIEARNVFRSFQRICKQYNLRVITLHGLRHSNGTLQKNLGVPDRDVQVVLGHSNTRTTAIYQHVDMTNKLVALEKVEHELFPKGGDGRGRSRQPSRQSPNLADKILTQLHTKAKTHPWWVGTCFGGSSQIRTGDTRLFRDFPSTVRERTTTSVRCQAQIRTRRHFLGIVAVNLAVNQHRTEPRSFRDERAA